MKLYIYIYCYVMKLIVQIAGLQADEIHLCGEAGSIELIEEICNTTGEELEVRK